MKILIIRHSMTLMEHCLSKKKYFKGDNFGEICDEIMKIETILILDAIINEVIGCATIIFQDEINNTASCLNMKLII